MESESDSTVRPGVHHVVDSDNGDDVASEESQTLDPPVPNLIMLGVLLLCTIATIVAVYFHGKMHLITVLKNAAHS